MDKVTRRCPQNTAYEERREPMRNRTDVRQPVTLGQPGPKTFWKKEFCCCCFFICPRQSFHSLFRLHALYVNKSPKSKIYSFSLTSIVWEVWIFFSPVFSLQPIVPLYRFNLNAAALIKSSKGVCAPENRAIQHLFLWLWLLLLLLVYFQYYSLSSRSDVSCKVHWTLEKAYCGHPGLRATRVLGCSNIHTFSVACHLAHQSSWQSSHPFHIRVHCAVSHCWLLALLTLMPALHSQ